MSESQSWHFQYSVPPLPQAGAVALTEEEFEKALLRRLETATDDRVQTMWQLAHFYKNSGKVDKAMASFKQMLDTEDDLGSRAQLILSMGQTAEKMGDYAMAVDFYRHALAHEPTNKFVWYFIHNNLGYSLIQLGILTEAEQHCRTAIQVDPERANAHKNLGLALQGQGRYREAVESFIAATQANASDSRALGLMETLLEEHPDLAFDFQDQLECCKKAVAVAAEAMAKAQAAWQAARSKK